MSLIILSVIMGAAIFCIFFSRLLYLTKNIDVVCIFSSRSVFFCILCHGEVRTRKKMNHLLLCARRRGPVRACLAAATTARVRSLSPKKKPTVHSLERAVGRPTRTLAGRGRFMRASAVSIDTHMLVWRVENRQARRQRRDILKILMIYVIDRYDQ